MSPIKWAAVPVQYEWLKTVSIAIALINALLAETGDRLLTESGEYLLYE